eukprot:c15941_g1_i2 orf=199-528(-)
MLTTDLEGTYTQYVSSLDVLVTHLWIVLHKLSHTVYITAFFRLGSVGQDHAAEEMSEDNALLADNPSFIELQDVEEELLEVGKVLVKSSLMSGAADSVVTMRTVVYSST